MKRQSERRRIEMAIREFTTGEEWNRVNHWWGFEYRHSATGRQWRVAGVWWWWTVLTFVAGLGLGSVLRWW